MTAADLCRERGWGVGTILQDYGDMCRITHVGKRYVVVHWFAYREDEQSPWQRLEDREVEEDFLLRSSAHAMTAIDRLPWEVPDASE